MPSKDLPTGSVSGRHGWGSERPADRDRPTRSSRRSTPRSDRPAVASRRERIEALRREVAALEAELERRNARMQYVIDHYEGLYSDLLEDYESARASDRARPDGLVIRLRRWLPGVA